jgi:hypothetical protein
VRLSRILALISFVISLIAVSAFAQDKPDPRIYATPQAQPEQQNPPHYRNEQRQQSPPDYRNEPEQQNPPDYGSQSQTQNPPDYRNEPEQQSSPDYRNKPEQQNPPEYGNKTEPQNPPDYRAQPPANMPPPPPMRRDPSEKWEPDAIAYLGQNASSRTEFNLDHSMVVLASKMDENDMDLRRVVAGVDGVSSTISGFQEMECMIRESSRMFASSTEPQDGNTSRDRILVTVGMVQLTSGYDSIT